MTTAPRLEAGAPAPAFTLSDSEGNTVSLGDYAGSKVVIYFYPAAATPGCTTQACDFRDSFASLVSAGYAVLGISRDPVAKLATFAADQSLNFPLLSDEDRAVHERYGAWGEKSMYGKKVTGAIRSTFVVDEEGTLTHALYNVKATGHVASLRKKLAID